MAKSGHDQRKFRFIDDNMATIDKKTTERLIQICGMLGSEHVGERANAARKRLISLREWAPLGET
jgi:hypothetical protein